MCPHGLGYFQLMEKVSTLQHKVLNSDYQLGGNREIIIKQETKAKQAKKWKTNYHFCYLKSCPLAPKKLENG